MNLKETIESLPEDARVEFHFPYRSDDGTVNWQISSFDIIELQELLKDDDS